MATTVVAQADLSAGAAITAIRAVIGTYIRGGTLPGALLVCEHAGACLGGAHGEAERRGEREGDEDELHVGF